MRISDWSSDVCSSDLPSMTVTTAPRADSPATDMTIQILDRSTGDATSTVDESGVMPFLLQLHTDMFLGLPGMLFLGLMGLLFVIAVVSGVVLRSEEHTSELQSLMRISYAVC